MSNEYKNNHYVPKWYQRKFIPKGKAQTDQKLYYLDLYPETSKDSRGVVHIKKALDYTGVDQYLCQDDLYTINFPGYDLKVIEKVFFGEIDSNGKSAVTFFENYDHSMIDNKMFNYFINYLTVQKLRTPKGLSWLSRKFNITNKEQLLLTMLSLQQLHASLWTECIWQIADASNSDTKFIISDHPVTVYNRTCGPKWCQRNGDPQIELQGTHTLFPLSENKILILTHISWVKNPYQSARNIRPNPTSFRSAIFNYMQIQINRYLLEEEVRQINFIIKNSAFRYIASGKEEWLYPEKFIQKSNWNTYGEGYLLMPDPRPIHVGGEILMGFQDGSVDAFDVYGRKPWDPNYNKEFNEGSEFNTLYKFQGEFAYLFGRKRRGRSVEGGVLDPEEDSEDLHKYHLSHYRN